MARYIQAKNFLPKFIFTTLKIALKLNKKNVKTRRIANILETAGNIATYSKFEQQTPLLGVL